MRIQLHADGRQRTTAHRDFAHAVDLRDFLREHRDREIVKVARSQIRRIQRERHDRRLRRIGFLKRRVTRHARGQLTARRVDRRLHVARRAVNVAPEREFQRDARRTLPAVGINSTHARNPAERALERRRDTRRHRIRTRARQRSIDPDRRKIDLRQRRHGQQPVREHSHEHERDRDQAARHGTPDKGTREVHHETSAAARGLTKRARSRSKYR